MKHKPADPSVEESAPRPKASRACFWKFIIPAGIFLLIGIAGALTLLHWSPWLIPNPHAQEIAQLKNQAATLDTRMNQLEGLQKASQPSTNDLEHLRNLENSVASLQSQIESIQNQPKVENSPQHLERSLAVEKDLTHLTEISQILKSAYLFLRLKTKVLSDAPYAAELSAFKATIKEPENLSILEKYADGGLQVLKVISPDPSPPRMISESDSWWSRVKSSFGSIIKVEKVDAPSSVSSSGSQDRNAIEELLAQLDRSLADKLKLTAPSLSPQPGDPS